MADTSTKIRKRSIIPEDPKIKRLLINSVIFSTIFAVCSAFVFTTVYVIIKNRGELAKKVEALNSENKNVLNQIKDINEKSQIAKKYIRVWDENFLEEQKSLSGLDMSKINAELQKIALDNRLANVNINFSPVIMVDSKDFEKNIIRTFTTLITMKFNAITDINVFRFLNDLESKFGYFITIQDLEMKRTRKIDDEFIRTLSSGNIITAVDVSVQFRVYGLGVKQ